jgi:hypothetical protein
MGSNTFVAAVLERLNATPTGVIVSDQDRRHVDGMLAVVRRLADVEPQSRAPQ